MPKFGANAFIWIEDWSTDKGNYAIQEASRLGFDLLEIPLMHPWDFDSESHIKQLQKTPIEITASVILPSEAHIPSHPEQAKKFLFDVLEKLDSVGGTCLCGCIAVAGGVFTGYPPTEDEKQSIIDIMGELTHKASQKGITIGLECVNRYETYLLNRLEDGYEIIEAVNADNFILHADTYHMNIEENNFYDPLVKFKDVLGYIHMSESHRGLIGTGTVNWAEIFEGLAAANYSGPLVLESFSANNPDLMAAIRLWHPAEESPEFLATEGLKFLQKWAEKVSLK